MCASLIRNLSLSVEEPRDDGLGLLQKVGWALGNESTDLHYHPSRRSIRSALKVDNHLPVIEHDQNYRIGYLKCLPPLADIFLSQK